MGLPQQRRARVVEQRHQFDGQCHRFERGLVAAVAAVGHVGVQQQRDAVGALERCGHVVHDSTASQQVGQAQRDEHDEQRALEAPGR